MGSIQIPCKVISPMFSYGNGKGIKKLEPRPTELKGLLRYVYRIASVESDTEKLYKWETALFGGQTSGATEKAKIKASPLRLQFQENKSRRCKGKQSLRRHVDKNTNGNGCMPCYLPGMMFDITLSMLPRTEYKPITSGMPEKKNLMSWYQDLFLLSMVIGGIGRRTRRARGCMTTQMLKEISRKELSEWITQRLNIICGCEAYQTQEDIVDASLSPNQITNRPVIEQIRIGRPISNVDDYLMKIDNAAHKTRAIKRDKYATGFTKQKQKQKQNGKPKHRSKCLPNRLASPAIVSLVEIKEGLFPVYTLVKAIYNGEPLDLERQERMQFLQDIEVGE
ncbi:hypothetical protein GCM10011391_12600 [Pullulanibacillus camelliae]|uniref:Uncharacterized protein n=1 Tax=Pullulanibacillus camelliae TaxID=1707096 RepID=A0A8J2YFX4_9BACL|nr:hypothetical protein [Pullulanibacillus camelliae]GGE35355.1 hypothetical protein GCM10011391_12600 [Pullulanibacillus camelliae]